MNTCFQQRISRPITFRSGETETMIDYILMNNKYRSSVKDVKAIPGEEIVSQHCLLSIDMVFKKKIRRKVKFRKKLKLWRLRESEVKEEFAEGVNNRCDSNENWCDLKRKLLDVANEVCGYMAIISANPGILKHGGGIKMWMCLCVERESYLGFGKRVGMSKTGKILQGQKDAKRIVYMAMDQKAQETVEKADSCHNGRELLGIAKQRVGGKKDVVGVSCL